MGRWFVSFFGAFSAILSLIFNNLLVLINSSIALFGAYEQMHPDLDPPILQNSDGILAKGWEWQETDGLPTSKYPISWICWVSVPQTCMIQMGLHGSRTET